MATLHPSTESPLKCLFFTWNVGNKMPLAAELEHWCPERGGAFDLIVVGTQENRFKGKGRTASVAPSGRKSVTSFDNGDPAQRSTTKSEEYEDADLDEVAVDFEEQAIEAIEAGDELSALAPSG